MNIAAPVHAAAAGLPERLRATRQLTLDLAAPLSDADSTIQPHPDASPAKWHLAHTTWFLETFVLRDHIPAYRKCDERWAYLFNSYYEGEGARHPRSSQGCALLATSSAADPQFRADVLRGLAGTPKAIPARWLYDSRGSELFDAITRLPSYYPTLTETRLLERIMPEVAGRVGSGRAVVEFGAGSLTKTPILLRAIRPVLYVPVDIAGDYLRSSAEELAEQIPGLPIHPLEADFVGPMQLPPRVREQPVLGFFPGSTIGNFVPQSATDLLRHFRVTLGTGALLLIGMDRVKLIERLLAA